MQTPHWFDTYINQQSIEGSVTVEGARVSYRTWGQSKITEKKQSLLFVHGHAAHTHWWDFIAPGFTDEYNVLAIDLTGNGNSDHRSQYSAMTYAKEILAVASLQQNTIVIGHSFGGMMTRIAAFLDASGVTSKIKGIMLVDSVIPTERGSKTPPPSPQKGREKPIRYYQNLETAMLRFRLKPPQKCSYQFVLDHIARHSLKKSAKGYSFKVDQGVFSKTEDNVELPSGVAMIQKITCPIGFIYGDRSRFFPREKHQFLEELMGKDSVVVIPDAAHHVFLDQPQAFIAALAALLLKIRY